MDLLLLRRVSDLHGHQAGPAHGVEAHPDQNIVLRFARRYLRVAKGSHGDKFFVRQDGKLYVTSLFWCCW